MPPAGTQTTCVGRSGAGNWSSNHGGCDETDRPSSVAAGDGCRVESPNLVAPPVAKERPTVNLPRDMRQSNWRGPQEQGSCTWATMVSLLRWQGRYRTADWVRQNCGDGEWPDDMAQKLDGAGIRYAYVTNGDVKFLEWACRTRRGCGITVMAAGAWSPWSISTTSGPRSWTTTPSRNTSGFRERR